MAGLPHILNSRAGTQYFEPIYTNLFEVSIIPPQQIAGGELLLEHVNSIGGLNQDKMEGVLEQFYKGATRSYASGKPETYTTDITVEFSLNLDEANSIYVHKTLRDWCRAIYNPLTGTQGLKRDYIGTLIVSNYTRDGQIFWRRTFRDIFPNGEALELLNEMSYDASELSVLSINFRSDWFSEATPQG